MYKEDFTLKLPDSKHFKRKFSDFNGGSIRIAVYWVSTLSTMSAINEQVPEVKKHNSAPSKAVLRLQEVPTSNIARA